MSTSPRPSSHVFTVTSAVVLSGLLVPWFSGFPAGTAAEYCALLLAAVIASLPTLQPAQRDWPALRLAFVVEFTCLLIFGAFPAMVVAASGLLTRELMGVHPAGGGWHRVFRGTAMLLAFQAAAWTYAVGDAAALSWPWLAGLIAASVLTYGLVASLSLDVLLPLAKRRSTEVLRHWSAARWLTATSVYGIAAGAAVGISQIVALRNWEMLIVTTIPLLLAYRVYREQLNRLDRQDDRREALESLPDGVCILDGAGRVTFWNDALEVMLACRRKDALGAALTSLVRGLGATRLPRAVDDVVRTGTPCTLPQFVLQAGDEQRTFQVKVVRVTDGAALFWQDITAESRAVHALRRHGERLGLAAEAASDGLWEWDLRTQLFYVTKPWKEMIGLPEDCEVTRAEQWLDRVHVDDIAPLRAALEAHLSGETDRFQHDHRIRHEDGTYRRFRCRGAAARVPSGRPSRVAGSLTDTSDLAATQEQLRNAVFLDPLTGLCNRALFVERLGRRLKESKRRSVGDSFALLYLDLDRFKVVNDSLGHLVGDELLVAVSRRLESCLRQGDVLSRLGGDEFAILLNALQAEQQANVIAFRVQETLSKPFSIGGREVFTSASIGIAFGAPQYTTPDEMMHDADTAMYQAKGHGKARHEVFDADMDARARDRLGLENDLRRAVSNDEIEVHYQPIVALATGMCVGFESLVRWTRSGTPVSPAVFIPMAEELGLIERLGTRVLDEACRTFAAWQRDIPHAALECITVNVSSRQLMQHNFLSVVDRAVRLAGMDRGALRIEITETALMTSPEEAAKVLRQLRDFGVKVYLDDFGTGYSSLSHLHNLPVDALKIDRSFVQSLFVPHRPAIVESIMALARTLHTNVVAEGIETEAQARELERLGCTHAQGFLFSRAVSPAAAEAILIEGAPLGKPRLAASSTAAAC